MLVKATVAGRQVRIFADRRLDIEDAFDHVEKQAVAHALIVNQQPIDAEVFHEPFDDEQPRHDEKNVPTIKERSEGRCLIRVIAICVFSNNGRILVAEGIDPANYRDPSWSSEPYAVDKLVPAVVMSVDASGVKTRDLGGSANTDEVTRAVCAALAR